jgi:hypothetical protein
LAHESVTDGKYGFEVGWVNEPPIVGQRNAIVVNVNDSTNEDAEIDISMLVVEVSYGGQTKTLSLQPVSEDSKNQYIAPILPTIPGKYTVKLSGMLNKTAIDNSIQPEEVQAADVISFPSAAAASKPQNSGLTWSEWLAIGGIVTGLAGLITGLMAFKNSR